MAQIGLSYSKQKRYASDKKCEALVSYAPWGMLDVTVMSDFWLKSWTPVFT